MYVWTEWVGYARAVRQVIHKQIPITNKGGSLEIGKENSHFEIATGFENGLKKIKWSVSLGLCDTSVERQSRCICRY